jgi:enolase
VHKECVEIGMDVASSEFFTEKGRYDLSFKEDKKSQSQQHLTSEELNKLYAGYAASYPIISIEDPFDQDDWEGWSLINSQLGNKLRIVGDDLIEFIKTCLGD